MRAVSAGVPVFDTQRVQALGQGDDHPLAGALTPGGWRIQHRLVIHDQSHAAVGLHDEGVLAGARGFEAPAPADGEVVLGQLRIGALLPPVEVDPRIDAGSRPSDRSSAPCTDRPTSPAPDSCPPAAAPQWPPVAAPPASDSARRVGAALGHTTTPRGPGYGAASGVPAFPPTPTTDGPAPPAAPHRPVERGPPGRTSPARHQNNRRATADPDPSRSW